MLANMVKYVFKAIKLNSAVIFMELSDTYQNSLKRDSDLTVVRYYL